MTQIAAGKRTARFPLDLTSPRDSPVRGSGLDGGVLAKLAFGGAGRSKLFTNDICGVERWTNGYRSTKQRSISRSPWTTPGFQENSRRRARETTLREGGFWEVH